MTTSTVGRSRPRAATSVARSIEGDKLEEGADEKVSRVRVLAAGVRLPWRE